MNDEKIIQAKPYAVGKYVWVFQNVILPKGTKTLVEEMERTVHGNRSATAG